MTSFGNNNVVTAFSISGEVFFIRGKAGIRVQGQYSRFVQLLCGSAQDKTAEQFPHFRGCAVHTFRMPLYADGKRVGRHFDGFHCAVGCGCTDDQPIPDLIQSLMMVAVDIQSASDILFQPCVRADCDLMTDLIPGKGLLHMIQMFSRTEGKILINTSAAGDIEYLHAPTDGKKRFFRLQQLFHKANLKKIQSDVGFSVSILWFLSEKKRCNIVSTAA